jgi:hypothetical protein
MSLYTPPKTILTDQKSRMAKQSDGNIFVRVYWFPGKHAGAPIYFRNIKIKKLS